MGYIEYINGSLQTEAPWPYKVWNCQQKHRSRNFYRSDSKLFPPTGCHFGTPYLQTYSSKGV